MQHEIRLSFTTRALSILDVNLNEIARLMKQQGFELSGLNVYCTDDLSRVIDPVPSVTATQLSLPLPAPSAEPEPVKATPPTRARRTPKTEPEQAQPETPPPAAANPGTPPPPRDKAIPRSPEGEGFEAQLRALLTPLAQNGRGAEVSQFVQDRGYKTLSAIPDSVIGAALAAAQQHFGSTPQ